MKATIDLPEELFRRAEGEAASRGTRLQDLLLEGLLQVLGKRPVDASSQVLPSGRFADGCGLVRTGVGDLSCNPRHLEGFGRR